MPGPRPAHTMLLTLIHSIALIGAAAPLGPMGPVTATTSQVPSGQVALPSAIRRADVPAQIQITATHFLATSLVNERQWLIFTNAERSLVRVRGLRPFEQALMPIPKGGSEGISVELIARSLDGNLLSTGTFTCEAIESTSCGVFFERTQVGLRGWIPRHNGRSLTSLKTQRSTTTAALSTAILSTAPTRKAATHVPVPIPAENRTKDKSRKLKKKLPVI